MNAILYLPQLPPMRVSVEDLQLPSPETGRASVPARVPSLLGCDHAQVDILICSTEYVAYSVFDYDEGPLNESAMQMLSGLTGNLFDVNDEDTILLGPVLLVTK